MTFDELRENAKASIERYRARRRTPEYRAEIERFLKEIRMEATDIPFASPEHLAELLAGMDGPIDTSDIPERTGPRRRVFRDANGRLPRRGDPGGP